MKKYYLAGGFLCLVLFFSQCTKNDNPYIPLKSKAELGQKIFFDKHLSEPMGQSCSSCHNPTEAFSDPNHLSTSPGAVKGLFGKRNSMALTYGMFTPPLHYSTEDETFIGGFFWDGRANTLEDQAKLPFFNTIEMNLKDASVLAVKIRSAEYYKDYVRIYGIANDNSQTILNNVADAIASFERTSPFNSFSSKYDYYLKGTATLSADEKKGLELFTNKAKCSNCHITDPDETSGKILFTDFTYDNIGVPVNHDNKFYGLPTEFNPLGNSFIDFGLGITADNLPDNGGQFKVPSLRNIAISAPYFHNGVFKTLDEVVHFYNTRDKEGVIPEVGGNVNDEELGDLHLTLKEEKQIVAFMKTLTDGYHAGQK
ncbi:MAG: cytochrome c peroxidase [Ginsengibacter sp.]